jgi:hypothetical protein
VTHIPKLLPKKVKKKVSHEPVGRNKHNVDGAALPLQGMQNEGGDARGWRIQPCVPSCSGWVLHRLTTVWCFSRLLFPDNVIIDIEHWR